MYKRGIAKDPDKQERINEMTKNLSGGKKKWVRYDEGAILYSMGTHSFEQLAKEAKAVYRVRNIVLVNTEKVDEYIYIGTGGAHQSFNPDSFLSNPVDV